MVVGALVSVFFFSSRRRHTRWNCDWSSDVCSSDLAKLLEDGEYLCSLRTMYRVLAEAGQVRERRAQRRHPVYTKPQLVATAPNQVWSWDTTKLPGPTKGTYYTLYVILDIFSRYIVGWQVTERESATAAQELIAACCARQRIGREQLTV